MNRTAALLIGIGLLSSIGAASAATFSWTGSGGGPNGDLWTASQNWQGNGAPGAGDIASFGSVGNNKSTTPTINSGQTVPIQGIAFGSAASPYDITGAGTLNIGASGISDSSGADQTFSVAHVGVTATETWQRTNPSGSLSFAGSTISLGANTLTVGGAGTINIANAISGTGGLTKSGGGTLNLTGVETYSGPTTVNTGTLSFGAAPNFDTQTGAGSVVLNGGTLAFNTSSASTFNALTVNDSAAINLGSSSVTFSQVNYASGSGATLTINNWNGTAGEAGTASNGIFITAEPSSDFLSNVVFPDVPNAQTGALWLTGGELVPVPEPQVYAGVFAIGLLGFAMARRRMLASV